MHLLFLAHRIPFPPDKGDKIRSFRLLEALRTLGTVELITHIDDARDLRHVAELRSRVAYLTAAAFGSVTALFRMVAAVFLGRPLSVAKFTSPAAAAAVRTALRTRPPDAIFVSSAQPVVYLPRSLDVPVIVDLVDVDSEKWEAYALAARGLRRLIFRREARLVRALEAQCAHRGFRIVLTTEREAAAFRDRVAAVDVAVIPNGADVPEVVRAPAERDLLVFVGAMDYDANVDAAEFAAREILPLIRARIPLARFRIVGRNPTSRVLALATLPGVEVTGEVPSVAPHLAAASVALVPLRVARGVQNKVLEALAAAVPVVTTPAVAASLGAREGVELCTGSSAAELADLAVRLIDDPAAATRLGEAGRSLVRRSFRWEVAQDGFRALVREATST